MTRNHARAPRYARPARKAEGVCEFAPVVMNAKSSRTAVRSGQLKAARSSPGPLDPFGPDRRSIQRGNATDGRAEEESRP